MKTRIDFVSNSSSSSFILKDAGFFKFFGITKQDISDAIVELLGGEEALERRKTDELARLEKAYAETPDDAWAKEYYPQRVSEIKAKGLKLFCIYDMTDEHDREECYKSWDSHFSWWNAPNEGDVKAWNSLENTLQWKCNFRNIYDVICGKDKELETSVYDSRTRSYVTNEFPGGAAFIKHLRRSLKVKTMREVLHDKDCTLMIHFDDNEVYSLKGMEDLGKADVHFYDGTPEDKAACESSKWESESCSSDRFFEVLIKHFIDAGKIDLSCPEFLEYWKVEDDDD